MIARLRRRHRLIFGALALGLSVLLYAALSARPGAAPAELPTVLADGTGLTEGTGSTDGTALRPFEDVDGDFTATEVTLTASGLVVSLAADLRSPDVLAYWSPDAPSGSLPDSAVLLGPLSAYRDNAFPRPAASGDGHLIFYSLGHQEVVAAGPLGLPGLPDQHQPGLPAPSDVTGAEAEGAQTEGGER